MSHDTVRLTFIGGGNMAHSLIAGLLERGWPPSQLCVSDPVPEQRRKLEEAFGVATTADNREAVREADVVLLAVKPQDLAAVSREIAADVTQAAALVISIAAGIRASDVSRWLDGAPVVRAMPNRPALLGSGATALYAPAEVEASERRLAAEILSAVGVVVWVAQETAMDAVTAISGSGPAYFFLLIEMLEEAGTALGLDQATARLLAIETAHGAARMARETDTEPSLLREQVTSKGGTTAAALGVLESADVRGIFRRAIEAAARRSAELAAEAGRR